MKAFHFNLETILELRREEEEEVELRLGKATGERNLLWRKKVEKEALRLVPSSMESSLQRGLYGERLFQEIGKLEGEIAQKDKELEALREEYREVRSRREGLDKLKEKRYKEYLKDRKRLETNTTDDLVNGTKWLRSKKERSNRQ